MSKYGSATVNALCVCRCLVMRLWDACMLEGNEVLLRAALAIWARCAKRVQSTTSADQFYELMAVLCPRLQRMSPSDCDTLMNVSAIGMR